MSTVSEPRSVRMLLGAACLVLAPVLEIVSALFQPSWSDDAGDVVAAYTDQRGAMIGALTLEMFALALLIAGTVWLAVALGRRVPALAFAGGVVGVAGLLVITFEQGIAAAAPSIVASLDPARATTVVHAVQSSAGVSTVEPLSVLNVVGFVLFAVAMYRSRTAPLWSGLALAAGSAVQTAGFAAGARGLIVAGFVVMLAGAARAGWALAIVLRPAPEVALAGAS